MFTSRKRRGSLRAAGLAATATGLTLAVAACGAPGGGNTPAASSKGKTIVFWHYLTDRESVLQRLADQYKRQTGVTVKLTLLSSDIEAQKFQASVQAHTLPDVVAAWIGPGEKLAPYAKQGIIYNLDRAMSSWASRFPSQALSAVSFPQGNTDGVKPGKYLVPLDTNNMQILYNKDLFAKAGIAGPPATWADFVADAQKLGAHGIKPFTTGFASWPLDSIATVYEWNIIGRDALDATFRGKLSYTSPAWIRFLDFFAQWRAEKVFDPGALGDDLSAAENQFVNGHSAMLFDGSWALGVFHQARPDFTHYGVFLPPPAPAATNPVYIPGGVGAELFVVGTSPQRKLALDFVKWLTDSSQQAQYATASLNLPANIKVQQSLLKNQPVLAQFASRMNQIQPTLPTGIPTPVATTLDAGLQRLLAGKSTPQAVAAAMQKAAKTGQAQ